MQAIPGNSHGSDESVDYWIKWVEGNNIWPTVSSDQCTVYTV